MCVCVCVCVSTFFYIPVFYLMSLGWWRRKKLCVWRLADENMCVCVCVCINK